MPTDRSRLPEPAQPPGQDRTNAVPPHHTFITAVQESDPNYEWELKRRAKRKRKPKPDDGRQLWLFEDAPRGWFKIDNALTEKKVMAALSPAAMKVYLYMRRIANDGGILYPVSPSIGDLACGCGITTKAVSAALTLLVSLNMIHLDAPRSGWKASRKWSFPEPPDWHFGTAASPNSVTAASPNSVTAASPNSVTAASPNSVTATSISVTAASPRPYIRTSLQEQLRTTTEADVVVVEGKEEDSEPGDELLDLLISPRPNGCEFESDRARKFRLLPICTEDAIRTAIAIANQQQPRDWPALCHEAIVNGWKPKPIAAGVQTTPQATLSPRRLARREAMERHASGGEA